MESCRTHSSYVWLLPFIIMSARFAHLVHRPMFHYLALLHSVPLYGSTSTDFPFLLSMSILLFLVFGCTHMAAMSIMFTAGGRGVISVGVPGSGITTL